MEPTFDEPDEQTLADLAEQRRARERPTAVHVVGNPRSDTVDTRSLAIEVAEIVAAPEGSIIEFDGQAIEGVAPWSVLFIEYVDRRMLDIPYSVLDRLRMYQHNTVIHAPKLPDRLRKRLQAEVHHPDNRIGSESGQVMQIKYHPYEHTVYKMELDGLE